MRFFLPITGKILNILMFLALFFVYSFEQDSLFTKQHYLPVPYIKGGMRRFSELIVKQLDPELLNGIRDTIIISLLVNRSGKVDSVCMLNSTNFDKLDIMIIEASYNVEFIYPDTSILKQDRIWINLPLFFTGARDGVSVFDKLRFWKR